MGWILKVTFFLNPDIQKISLRKNVAFPHTYKSSPGEFFSNRNTAVDTVGTLEGESCAVKA